MQFQHSLECDELQTTAWVRFQVTDDDTSTLQSCNMHNMDKNNFVWEPVFQFVPAFQILYKNYGKHPRESFRELWSNMFGMTVVITVLIPQLMTMHTLINMTILFKIYN